MGELSAPVVVLRVTVRAPDLDAFITRYSRHIAGDRIFIFSKAPQPVGTQVRFNLQLTSGEVLIQGRGTVKRVQADGGDARHPPGMEVQFTPLDERSATLVDFMMATRAGLTESVATAASPIVRAVVPPKPTLPLPPAQSKPMARPASPLPPPPPSSPLPPPSSPPSPPQQPAAQRAAPWTRPKPTPVARPPSLSLESVWKGEAGEEAATQVSAPPSQPPEPAMRDSQPATHGSEPGPPPPLPPSDAPPPSDALPSSDAPPPLFALPPGAIDSSPLALLAAGALDPAPDKPGELATIIPPTVDPSINATPVFAESWGGDAPANPFSDVSDGAIEYFVEWSLEQSIGPRAFPQARFSDVAMVLPGQSGKFSVFDPATRRQRLAQLGVVFAAGALIGGILVGLVKRSPAAAPPSAPLAASVVGPSAAAASPASPTPPAREATVPAPLAGVAAAGDGELTITSRPPGASVTIDGAPSGTTPTSVRVAPGKHAIVLTKERYSALTTTGEAPGKLSLDLRRPTATLHVTSTPAAADVIVAGERRGKTPVDIKLPGYESYDVRVALAGAKPWRKSVYLSHAQNRVDAALATPPRAGRR